MSLINLNFPTMYTCSFDKLVDFHLRVCGCGDPHIKMEKVLGLAHKGHNIIVRPVVDSLCPVVKGKKNEYRIQFELLLEEHEQYRHFNCKVNEMSFEGDPRIGIVYHEDDEKIEDLADDPNVIDFIRDYFDLHGSSLKFDYNGNTYICQPIRSSRCGKLKTCVPDYIERRYELRAIESENHNEKRCDTVVTKIIAEKPTILVASHQFKDRKEILSNKTIVADIKRFDKALEGYAVVYNVDKWCAIHFKPARCSKHQCIIKESESHSDEYKHVLEVYTDSVYFKDHKNCQIFSRPYGNTLLLSHDPSLFDDKTINEYIENMKRKHGLDIVWNMFGRMGLGYRD